MGPAASRITRHQLTRAVRIARTTLHDLHETGLRGITGMFTLTEVLLWNTGSPVNSACSHHAVCSGRSLFCRAASSD